MVADVWKHRGLQVEADTAKRQGPPAAAEDILRVAAVAGTAVAVGLREADTAAKHCLPHTVTTTEYEPADPNGGLFLRGPFSFTSILFTNIYLG
jgi:hypothetical protein